MNKAEEIATKIYPFVTADDCCGNAFVANATNDDIINLRSGFIKGYEQAEKDLGWISVKDRLPDKHGWYFTCVNDNGVPQCVGLCRYTYGGWIDDEDEKTYCVDYWMEIPQFKF